MMERNYGRIVNVSSVAGKEGNPNAVAYSSGYLTVPQMIKPGFILNVIGVLLASFFCLTLAPLIFDFPLRHVHDQEGACY